MCYKLPQNISHGCFDQIVLHLKKEKFDRSGKCHTDTTTHDLHMAAFFWWTNDATLSIFKKTLSDMLIIMKTSKYDMWYWV